MMMAMARMTLRVRVMVMVRCWIEEVGSLATETRIATAVTPSSSLV